MKIKIISSGPKVAVPGLGIVKTNEWVTVTKEQQERFERIQGKPVSEAFDIKKETKPKKEAS